MKAAHIRIQVEMVSILRQADRIQRVVVCAGFNNWEV